MLSHAVVKKVLLNGMTILVHPVDTVPKVAIQLTYHVGSKDEESKQKGLAHLIEHMIFKGTEKLSESDINVITHKLSGYTNAFTSYDMTAYVYEFPTQHWQEGFPLLSDCMRNCRFDEQMLNSELKAVIQELKMYRDDYIDTSIHELFFQMFHDHPYHYPIIGFKQDLWNLDREELVNFYKKHYVPNNAVLTVVGDVDPEEVFAQAEKEFGAIPSDETYERRSFYHGRDLIAKEFSLQRDVQQPFVMMSTALPGGKAKKHYVHAVLNWLLGAGHSSRLTKKLVDELQLVTSFETFYFTLEESTPFFIYFTPNNIEDTEKIKNIIYDEINKLIESVPHKDLVRATKKLKMSHLSLLESNRKQASEIAESFLYTGDENFAFNYMNYAQDDLEREIKETLVAYFSPSTMTTGKVVPLNDADKKKWTLLQEIGDAEDARILEGRSRNTEIEPPKRAHEVSIKPSKEFHFHSSRKHELSNGLKVFEHNDSHVPKITLMLSLKNKSQSDPQDKQGIYGFVCDMLLEGSKNYPGKKLSDELEEYGMSFSAAPGYLSLSMLSEDLEKGLELLNEILVNVSFDEDAIEKVRHQLQTDLKMYWDEPKEFFGQLVRQEIYKGHPYEKNAHGTFDSLKSITTQDLKSFYQEQFSPKGARLSVVGDFGSINIVDTLENYLGNWKREEPRNLEYPSINEQFELQKDYNINRDQVVLGFARPSITRLDSEYDKLLLFDQIFGGGSTGTMSSKLFQLREQSGLFYTINGSLTVGSDEQVGLFLIKTIVSCNRLDEAKKVIRNLIDTVIDTLTEDELVDAKQAVINAQVDNFRSQKSTAAAFIALDKYKFSDDYFDTRAEVIEKITLQEVKEAAKKYLDSSTMMTVQIGRLSQDNE